MVNFSTTVLVAAFALSLVGNGIANAFAQSTIASQSQAQVEKPQVSILLPKPKSIIFVVLIRNIPHGINTLNMSLQVGNNSAVTKTINLAANQTIAAVLFNKVPAVVGNQYALTVNNAIVAQGVVKGIFGIPLPVIRNTDLSQFIEDNNSNKQMFLGQPATG